MGFAWYGDKRTKVAQLRRSSMHHRPEGVAETAASHPPDSSARRNGLSGCCQV
ncbi:hypothetical protein SynPROS91_00830 [Synechococcus sp. PROS-9-1]|nr:hypothetical protein SynPROS91_00830 [Synechococcus sp. PROS-9-1]